MERNLFWILIAGGLFYWLTSKSQSERDIDALIEERFGPMTPEEKARLKAGSL